MAKYKITLERIMEEVVEIEADSEDAAYELVAYEGMGEMVDYLELRPTLVASEELPPEIILPETTIEDE